MSETLDVGKNQHEKTGWFSHRNYCIHELEFANGWLNQEKKNKDQSVDTYNEKDNVKFVGLHVKMAKNFDLFNVFNQLLFVFLTVIMNYCLTTFLGLGFIIL